MQISEKSKLLTCLAAPKHLSPSGFPCRSLTRERAVLSSPLASSLSTCSNTCHLDTLVPNELTILRVGTLSLGCEHTAARYTTVPIHRNSNTQKEVSDIVEDMAFVLLTTTPHCQPHIQRIKKKIKNIIIILIKMPLKTQSFLDISIKISSLFLKNLYINT